MASKFVGCGLGAKACKYSWQESCKVGIGMMVRGEVCLIVANTGKAQGLISEQFYPAIILLIIVSSILTPLFLKMLYKKFPHTELPELVPISGGDGSIANEVNGDLAEPNGKTPESVEAVEPQSTQMTQTAADTDDLDSEESD